MKIEGKKGGESGKKERKDKNLLNNEANPRFFSLECS
jgi:hypothetical protein